LVKIANLENLNEKLGIKQSQNGFYFFHKTQFLERKFVRFERNISNTSINGSGILYHKNKVVLPVNKRNFERSVSKFTANTSIVNMTGFLNHKNVLVF
jgi:hypothetical protein